MDGTNTVTAHSVVLKLKLNVINDTNSNEKHNFVLDGDDLCKFAFDPMLKSFKGSLVYVAFVNSIGSEMLSFRRA